MFWVFSVGLTLRTQPRDSSSSTVCGLSAQEGLEIIDPQAECWMPWEDPVTCSRELWTSVAVGRSRVEGS